MQRQFPHLRPDHADTAGDALPSFAGIRSKTLETLYPDSFAAQNRTDRSPKGSVDQHIQELVDLINAHPSFATLSSCSGRISLFDHGVIAFKEDSAANANEDTADRADSSGKGGSGGWLLVSHDEIEASELIHVFREKGEATTTTDVSKSTSSSILSFKLEPMLMHVAAASLERGQQLLQLALRLGFRESGLIVTATRITVAIRGYGLTLSVPLALQGPLRTSEEYLVALVAEANRRLRTNITRIQKVHDEIEQELFRPVQSCGRIQARPLPDLNLWGHAAVSIPRGEKGDVDLLVFGGYGRGPSVLLSGSVKEASNASRRSDAIYCLQRSSGAWDSHWHQVDQELPTDGANALEHTSQIGVTVHPFIFTAREGAAACVVPGTSLVAIFGGRKGPAQPLDELFLYAYPDCYFQQPVDIRGNRPLGRWGHSLTALSGDGGNVAVLVGGRNETASFDYVHVLSIVGNDLGSKSLLWEFIVFTSPLQPRFHHSAAVVDDSVFIFGGLSDPSDLLEPFSEETEDPSIFSFKVSSSSTAETVHTECLSPHFGQAACALLVSDSSGGSHRTILLTGGLPLSGDGDTGKDDHVQWLRCSRKKNKWHLSPQGTKLEPTNSGGPGLGPLVHHTCVALPSLSSDKQEVVLVGGGASGFAFSQCFAGSHHLELSMTYDTENVAAENSAELLAHVRQANVLPSEEAKDATASTRVVFVTKRNAKSLKTLLEESSLLDKTYRMTAADPLAPLSDPSLYIAVPVTKQCLDQLESMRGQAVDELPAWMRLVEGTGQQQVPYSTSCFARQK
jgi:tRNA wybutosine-synthesizing protein 3